MDTFDYENTDHDGEDPNGSKEHFEDEIKKFRERLSDGGGGSTNIESLEEIVAFYFEGEKYDEALHFITLLLEYIPFSADTWQRKSIILNNLQRHNEALECIDHALKLNPVDAELMIGRGLTLDNLSRFEEAIESYDLVLETDAA